MEHIATPKVENVQLLDNINTRNSSLGTLYITTTHLIFVSPEEKEELWILHMHLNIVEKLPLTTSGTPIRIQCSNFRTATFLVHRDRDAQDVYTSLIQLSRPLQVQDLYCFQYRSKSDLPQQTGWKFFDLGAEFARQGVPNSKWVSCGLNSEYRICPTYPSQLLVPASATTQLVLGSAKFRSKGRLPALTFFSSDTGAALVRCSQPLSGLKGRSQEDEKYISCISESNPESSFVYIVDTRPKINAMANRAGGKGYESEAFYSDTKFVFKGIENIHIMRESLSKLVETCEFRSSNMELFMQGIEQSQWLKHCKAVIEASLFIAEAISAGTSVVVHCSDGWDRTSQTCALAQLLLDPYYRTVQGFQALIEKDWLHFGHKFSDRCGFLAGDSREISPVFTQFIDTTWQVMMQFPQAFQFNCKYLLAIHDHLYSCQYGTFIGNCQKERQELKLSDKSYSLWGFLTNSADEFVNPLYDNAITGGVLTPSVSPQSIRFWRGLYCRFEVGTQPREPVIDLLTLTQLHTASLEDHAKHLAKRVDGLKSLISSTKAGGAVKKLLPTSVTGTIIQDDMAKIEDSDLDKVEKRFVDLKSSLMEACQSSKL